MVEPHVSEAIDSQNAVGRKRKQPAVAKTSEVDSNLTLLDENVADKAEPRAKRGRARASLTSGAEKSVRSRRVDDAVTGDSAPRLCLLVTGLSEAQTTRLRRACQQAQSLGIATISLISSPAELLHDAAQARKDTPKFTHVVTSPNKGGRTARTFKYLVGLVSGAWVVKLEWLLDSVKAKKLLTESEYVISGDTAMPQYALFGPRPVGQLLAGYSVYVWSDEKSKSVAHTPDELMDLIRVAGGEIKTECPAMSAEEEGSDNDETIGAVGLGNRTQGDKAISTLAPKYRELFEKPVHKDKTIILVDTGDKATTGSRCASFLDTVMEQAGGGLACRSKSWLFDCISANTII
ncbi:hypothetical protein GGI24_005925 [Coemansia furcata]|nr:hypothetical protein GGI24_005925 [Coemansia furcata]